MTTRLNTQDAADYLGMAESTLRWWRHCDIGPRSYRIGQRKVFYDVADLDAFVASEAARDGSVRGGARVA